MSWAMRLRQQPKTLGLLDFSNLLESCIHSKSLSGAKLVHQHLLKNQSRIEEKRFVNGLLEKLTRLYMACNEVEHARHVFDGMPEKPRNVTVWNSLIRSYAWNGPFEEAIDLYYKMIEYGTQPDKFTYPFVLKACSALQAIQEGEEIHAHAKSFDLEGDVYVSTALIDMYMKCGYMSDAKRVFGQMGLRDVVAWNSMIAGFSLHSDGGIHYDEVMRMFVDMQRDVSLNSASVVAVLPSVAQANNLRQGKEIHGFCVRKGYDDDVVVGTGLLDMYAKCGSINCARSLFDMMGIVRNEITWSSMIGAYVICDFTTEALQLFRCMLMLKDETMVIPTAVTLATVIRACAKLTDLNMGRCLHCYIIKLGFVSDLMVVNTLLSMLSKCGNIHDAIRFFNETELKDTVSFNAIMSGCVQNGNIEEALCMFQQMEISGMHPDSAAMVSVMQAFSHLAALRHGSCSHSYAIVRGFATNTTICNALIDMYAKCGRIDTSRGVFDRMQNRDIVSWNTMILAYGIHGLGREALSLFREMQAEGLKPDDVTFINLLSACTHSGLVTEGKHWFSAMSEEFHISPRMEHCICMADLLGRAGLFEELQSFIKQMPYEPDIRVWSAMLAACRIHKNIELGEEVSKKIQILGPESTGSFVLLSNMYSAAGRWDAAAQVRISQRGQGFKKSPGCSWIEIKGVVHAFVGGDRSHPEFMQINNKIDELLVEMKRLGYQADSGCVLQDIEEEEKERILLHHSEKLAIAYGLIYLSPNMPIIVTKNLRVCGDCHTAVKYITLVANRDITVRDASRFHHFKDGTCNCGDFW